MTDRLALATTLLLAGCPAPPPPRSVALAAPYEPDLTDCQQRDATARVAFEPGVMVDVITCTTGPDITPATAETIEDNRKALLVLHGRRPAPYELATWSDGWEWGESWHLDGVLRADNRSAVVVTHSAASDGGHSTAVLVLAIADDQTTWKILDQREADDATVTIAPDRASVRISICHDDGPNAQMHACRADPARITDTTLRWNGHTLQ